MLQSCLALLAGGFLLFQPAPNVTEVLPLPEPEPAASQIVAKPSAEYNDQKIEDVQISFGQWMDRGISAVICLLVGYLLAIAKQRQEAKYRDKGLANACRIQLKETAREIENLGGRDTLVFQADLVGVHAASLSRLKDLVFERMKWLHADQSEKAHDAWSEYHKFKAEGCRDAEGSDDESVWNRFNNQSAETVRERLCRLLDELEAALK
jgi:hypothetical protein